MKKPSIGDTMPVICACGNNSFKEVYLLRRLSRILTGEPKDTIITIPALVCAKCDKMVEEMMPQLP